MHDEGVDLCVCGHLSFSSVPDNDSRRSCRMMPKASRTLDGHDEVLRLEECIEEEDASDPCVALMHPCG